jgi:hypothetical protein
MDGRLRCRAAEWGMHSIDGRGAKPNVGECDSRPWHGRRDFDYDTTACNISVVPSAQADSHFDAFMETLVGQATQGPNNQMNRHVARGEGRSWIPRTRDVLQFGKQAGPGNGCGRGRSYGPDTIGFCKRTNDEAEKS